jgi:hypothetical protein
MHFRPNRYPDAQRQRNGLVGMLELAGDNDGWAAFVVFWTGSWTDVRAITTTSRWGWNIQFMLCNWCGLFHRDYDITAMRVREVSHRYEDEPWYRLRLLSYCYPCVLLSTSPNISRDTHTFCHRCCQWVVDCEHLFPPPWL